MRFIQSMRYYLVFKRMEILTEAHRESINNPIPCIETDRGIKLVETERRVELGAEELLEMCLISPELQDKESREF